MKKKKIYRPTDKLTDGLTETQMVGRTDGWMDQQTDGPTNGRMDRPTDGPMDGPMDRLRVRQSLL